jgi:hypothetical protein
MKISWLAILDRYLCRPKKVQTQIRDRVNGDVFG